MVRRSWRGRASIAAAGIVIVSVAWGAPPAAPHMATGSQEMIASLLATLRSPEANQRQQEQAAERLGHYGTRVRDSIPDLVEVFRRGNSHQRRLAGRVLCELGNEGLAAGVATARRLDPASHDARWALECLGPDVFPLLVPIIQGNDAAWRRVAIDAMGTAHMLADGLTDEQRKAIRDVQPQLLEEMAACLRQRGQEGRATAPFNALRALGLNEQESHQIIRRFLGEFPGHSFCAELLKLTPDGGGVLANEVRLEAYRRRPLDGRLAKAPPAEIVKQLLASAQYPNEVARYLQPLAAQAADQIPVLEAALNDPRPGRAHAAACGLACIGGTAEKPLLRALESPSKSIREAAASAAAYMDPITQPVVLAVGRLLEDADPRVVHAAAESLRQQAQRDVHGLIAATAPALLAVIGNGQAPLQARYDAVGVLNAMVPPPPEASAVLIRVGGDRTMARSAAGALSRYGPEVLTQIRPLLANGYGREHAPEITRGMGRHQLPAAVEKIRPLLRDSDPQVRAGAVKLLGPCGIEATALLITAASDSSEQVRKAVEGMLGELPQAALPRLAASLTAEGPANVAVSSAIARIVQWNASQTRSIAAERIVRSILPRLIAALDTPDATVRNHLMATLISCGPMATDDLLGSLQSKSAQMRAAAIRVLGANSDFGNPPPANVRAALAAAMTDPDLTVRRAAVMMLARSHLPEAVPGLVEFLCSDDAQIRQEASHTLQMYPELPVDLLLKAAQTHDKDRQMVVIEVLSKVRDQSLTRLLELTSSNEEPIRRVALHALAQNHTQKLEPAQAELASPGIIRALGEPELSLMAYQFLASQGQNAAPILRKAVAEGSPAAVIAAAGMLADQGDFATETVAALVSAIRSVTPQQVQRIEELLQRFLPSPRPAAEPARLSAIARDLAGPAAAQRIAAARRASELGAAAHPLTATLARLVRDKDPAVRDAAEKALRGIYGEPAPNERMAAATSGRGPAAGPDPAQARTRIEAMGFRIVGEPMPWVNGMRLSANKKTSAFAQVVPGRGMRLVMNGVPQPVFPGEIGDRIAISADGSAVAYVVTNREKGQQDVLVLGGKQIASHKAIGWVSLSHDGCRYAYLARDEGHRGVLYLDGKRVDDYFAVGDLAFSEDGATVVWAAAKVQPENGRGGYDIYVNGTRFAAGFRHVGPDLETASRPIVLSADGKRWAVQGQVFGPQWGGIGGYAVMADGAMGPVFGEVVNGTLQFSPDSQTLLYAAGTPQKNDYTVYRNAVAMRPWSYIAPRSVRLQGQHIAFTGYAGESSRFVAHHPHATGSELSWSPGMPGLVVDDVLKLPNVTAWATSADCRHVLAVRVVMEDPRSGPMSSHLLWDGRQAATFVEGATANSLDVSPAGRHWLYVIGDREHTRLVVDGRECVVGPLMFDTIGFSAEDQITAIAQFEGALWHLTLKPEALRPAPVRSRATTTTRPSRQGR